MAISTLFDFGAPEYSRAMRRSAIAGLILCLAALPLTQACATSPGQSSPAGYSGVPASSAPIASSAAATPDLAAAAPAPTFDPSGYKVDSAKSKALSDYLTQHKLPLVGAQVMRGPDAQRGVVLYGFVGSDFGKQDAVAKARNFLNDPSLAVNNRIKVNPELLTSAQPADSSPGGAGEAAATNDSSSYPGADAYTQNQQSEAQQYVQNQNRNAQLSAMAPALMIGMMALSIASGGNFSVMPGPTGAFGSPGYSTFGGPIGSPFGGPPPGYPSPYSPYGP